MNTEEMRGGVLKISIAPTDLKDPQKANAYFEKLLRVEERKRLLVDISTVKDATSLMIGALLSLHLLAYENLAILKFTGLSPKIQMLFKLLGVDKVIEAHYGIEEAMKSFDDVGAPPGYGQ